jgi:hypothetical protein
LILIVRRGTNCSLFLDETDFDLLANLLLQASKAPAIPATLTTLTFQYPNMASSTPLPYTASPLRLAWEDTILFCKVTFVWPITAGLLSIVLPFWPLRSGPLDELYPSAANIWTITLHIVLIILQTIFLLSLAPLAFCGIPAALYFAYVCGFVLFNKVLSGLINGPRQQHVSSIDLSRYPSHDDERWIFINGVAVGCVQNSSPRRQNHADEMLQ